MDDRPCRGDAVHSWLQAKRDACTYEFERRRRNTIDDLIKDYLQHADTGTPLVQEVDMPSARSTDTARYAQCPLHGWQPFCEVPGLTSEPTCAMCI